jgi:hypothetical protein
MADASTHVVVRGLAIRCDILALAGQCWLKFRIAERLIWSGGGVPGLMDIADPPESFVYVSD